MIEIMAQLTGIDTDIVCIAGFILSVLFHLAIGRKLLKETDQ